MGPVTPKAGGPIAVAKDRLDSWKAIASYLGRDVRTAQRWEHDWGLPIHRLPGGPKAGVFAYRREIDEWLKSKPVENGSAAPSAEEAKPRTRRIFLRVVLPALVVLIGTAVWWALSMAQNPKNLLSAQMRFTPFATSLPLQTCPAWSPDGKRIAFTTRIDGRSSVMTQALDAATPSPVTGPEVTVLAGGDPVWCRTPLWSPDSQSVYFLGRVNNSDGLLRAPTNGGESVMMQQGALAAALSPDGETIVFLARSNETNRYRLFYASPPASVRRPYEPAPIDTPGFSNIPRLGFQSDGKGLAAVITINSENQYWWIPWPPSHGHRIFQRAERAVGAPDVAWLPDSRHVVFGVGMLGAGDTVSGRYWPIAIHDHPMTHPAPSPDGTRIAYESSLSHADAVAVPIDGGPIETLLGTSASEENAAVSPVSSAIVYIVGQRPKREIRVKDLETGADRLLVRAPDLRIGGEATQFFLTPVFSPDGQRVAFVAVAPSGAKAVFTIPAAGGIPTRATGAKNPAELTPEWSPDGRQILLRRPEADRWKLTKVRPGALDSGEAIAEACGASMPAWSPSDEWIAFYSANCRPALIRPDGSERHEIDVAGPWVWSRDGKTLFGVAPTGRELIAMDLASGRKKTLRGVGDTVPWSGPQPGLRATLTADGKRIVYSVLKPREEIWILEDFRLDEPWFARFLGLLKR